MVKRLSSAQKRLLSWYETPSVFFYDELKMEPEPWLDRFIDKLPSQDPKEVQIALKACTGAGKSAALAGANLWFLSVFGGKTGTEHPRAIVTSIDEANLKSGLWGEMAAWRSRSAFLMAAFELTASRLFVREAPDTWFVEKRSWAKKADPEAQGRAMSGLHAPWIMATIDESGDVPVPLLRVAQQIFSSKHRWAKLLTGGNPTSLGGVLYEACVKQAERTTVITITADPEDANRGRRTDIANAREMIRLYGRTNPWVMATILGEFPPGSITSLLGIEDIETAMRRHYRKDQYDWCEKRLGVDCARFGDDRTTLCPRQGPMWFKPVEMRGARTSVISARIISALQKWQPEDPNSIRVLIDQTGGWGQGTVDQLLVAGYSPMDLVYSTPSPEPQFYNLRSYMYWKMADHIRTSAALPAEITALKRELTEPTYSIREGRLYVEPKELIKKRLSGMSPDLADGYAQTYAIPDLPRQSLLRREQNRHALADWDPNRDEEQTKAISEFNPFAGVL